MVAAAEKFATVACADFGPPASQAARNWASPTARRELFDELRRSKGAANQPMPLEAFYGLDLGRLVPSGLRTLCPAPTLLIRSEHPEHHWESWKFKTRPQGLWDSLGQSPWWSDPVRTSFVQGDLESLAVEYNITSPDGWQGLLVKHGQQKLPFYPRFAQLGGLGPVLARVFPAHHWNFPASSSNLERAAISGSTPPRDRSYWSSASNRKKYLLELKTQLGGTWESLYDLSPTLLIQTGGSLLLRRYNNSLLKLLQAEFPQRKWMPWRFVYSKRKYFSLATQFKRGDPTATKEVKRIFANIAKQIGVRTKADWTKLADKLAPSQLYILSTLGGVEYVLSRLESNETYAFIAEEQRAARNKAEERSRALWRLAEAKACTAATSQSTELTPNILKSLYNTTNFEVLTFFGRGAQTVYNSSVSLCIASEYPYHSWRVWDFDSESKTWWAEVLHALQPAAGSEESSTGVDLVVETAVRLFIDDLVARVAPGLRLEDWREWYQTVATSSESSPLKLLLPHKLVVRSFLINHYQNEFQDFEISHPELTLPLTLSTFATDHVRRFAPSLPKRHWKTARNRREFLDWLVREYFSSSLFLTNLTAEAKSFTAAGGLGLLNQFGKSPASAFSTEFPEHPWKMWQFGATPRQWWDMISSLFYKDHSPVVEAFLRNYLDDLATQFRLGSPAELPLVLSPGGVKSSSTRLSEPAGEASNGEGDLVIARPYGVYRMGGIKPLLAALGGYATAKPNQTVKSASQVVQHRLSKHVDALVPDQH